MNDKIWAVTIARVYDKGFGYEIPEGAFVRILPWMAQKEYGNVKIEYIAQGDGLREVYCKEKYLEKLTKAEVRLMDLLYKDW